MKWISVEQELPNLLKKVLFHWICPGGNRNVSMGYLCNDGWDIYLPYHSYKMCPQKLKVTHWMELPDFPHYDGDLPFTGSLFIDEPEKADDEKVKAFAKKFCEDNKDMLKRLADR